MESGCFEMTKAEQVARANTPYESEEGVVLGVEAGIADVQATGSQGSAYLPKSVCPSACSRRGVDAFTFPYALLNLEQLTVVYSHRVVSKV